MSNEITITAGSKRWLIKGWAATVVIVAVLALAALGIAALLSSLARI